jgi:hypothetical protein
MYFLNRETQRKSNYTGISGIAMQDLAITESMGPIVDRSQENVGAGDILVVRTRRYLLKMLRKIETGERVAKDNGADYPDIDTRMVIAPKETSYEDILTHREWKWGEAKVA